MGQRCVLASAALASVIVVSCGIEPEHPPPLIETIYATAPAGGALGPSDAGNVIGTAGEAGGAGEAGAARDTGAAGDAAAAKDGSLAVTDGGVCATVIATTLVTQQQVASPPPQPTGGVVVPGTYVLSQMNMYTGADGGTGPTSKVLAEKYQVDSSTYEHAKAPGTDAGPGSPSLDSGYYAASGTMFTVLATCPASNPSLTFYYSVAPGFLKLLFGNEEYVFTKR
jgi:hypothetical protein